jgi:hypothetical protein
MPCPYSPDGTLLQYGIKILPKKRSCQIAMQMNRRWKIQAGDRHSCLSSFMQLCLIVNCQALTPIPNPAVLLEILKAGGIIQKLRQELGD